jgi:NAD(P)-dependent dehydrogenase (short-subunit alcohol dehydrogenase family)
MATALVTGATKRIGREICLELADKGLNIALHYNSAKSATIDTLTGEIKDKGVECRPFQCDFADFEAVSTLIGQVKESFPDLSVLINNASIFEPSTIQKTEEELYDVHFAVNLKAPFFLSKSFAENIEDGHIINILDTKITGNQTPYAAYLLTKKALAELTKMSAKEFAPRVKVNAIAPGLILPQEGKETEYFDKLAQKIPLKKRGYPEDIAKAVTFFLESAFITGEIIFIDGGENLK